MYLALDQSTAVLGWALTAHAGAEITAGTEKVPRYPSFAEKLSWYESWLTAALDYNEVTNLCFETPFTSTVGLRANRKLHALAEFIEYIAWRHAPAVRVREVAIHSWRLHWLGTTRAPKGTPRKERRLWLKQRARDRCAEAGLVVDSDDAADAVGILQYVLHCDLGGEPE